MKKFSAFALCIVLMLSLAMPVGARNFITSYAVNDSNLIAVGMAEARDGEVSVTVNGVAVDPEISTVGSENIPVTYVVMQDCSSSLSLFQKNAQSAFISSFASKLRPVDRMMVIRMAGKLSVGKVLTTAEEIKAEIAAPMTYSWGVMLYDNIMQILKTLEDEQTYPGMKCVVVLSDGRDDQLTAVTESDAMEALRNSDIPVFGVGLMDQFPDNYFKNMLTSFEELCRTSNGGRCFTVDQESMKAADAAEQITALVQNQLAVKLNAGKLARNGNAVELVITAGNKTGSITVPAAELPAYAAPTEAVKVQETEPIAEEPTEITAPPAPIIVPAPTAETAPVETAPIVETAPTAESAVETTAAPEKETIAVNTPSGEKSNSNLIFYLLIGGGVAAIVAAVAVLILLLRPRYDYEEELETPDSNGLEFMAAMDPVAVPDIKLSIPDEEWKEEPVKQILPMEHKSEIKVEKQNLIVRLIYAEDRQPALTLKLPVNGSKTLGRNTRADIVLNETDTSLSGLHFELYWDGHALQLRDCGSTNGTTVNGARMPADTWIMIKDGSSLRVGSYEYGIYYRKEKA